MITCIAANCTISQLPLAPISVIDSHNPSYDEAETPLAAAQPLYNVLVLHRLNPQISRGRVARPLGICRRQLTFTVNFVRNEMTTAYP